MRAAPLGDAGARVWRRWRCSVRRRRAGARRAHPVRQPDRLARRQPVAAAAAARRPAPVSVRLAGGLQSTDGTLMPRVTRVELACRARGCSRHAGCACPAPAPQRDLRRRWPPAGTRWSAAAGSKPRSSFRTSRRSRPRPAARLQRPVDGRRAIFLTPSPPARRPSSSCPSCSTRPRRFRPPGRRPAPLAGPLAALRPLRSHTLPPLRVPRPRAQLPQRLLPDPETIHGWLLLLRQGQLHARRRRPHRHQHRPQLPAPAELCIGILGLMVC